MRTPSSPPGSPGAAWRGLLDLLFPLPPGCPFCGTRVSAFAAPAGGERPGRLCAACFSESYLAADDVCAKCGRPQPGPEGLCMACWRRFPPFDRARAVGPYAGRLREAVLRMKAGGEAWLADPLAELMALRLRSDFFPPDLVVPVPAHPRRRRERGFNQAEALARSLCRRLRLPLETGALVRRTGSAPQAGLPGAGRRENALAAYASTGIATVEGKKILLVDDIYTTGSTASACALALRRAGAAGVDVLVVAVSILD